ncbi:MAG: LysM peptidoglycan-binding domain-containing protein [Planctomycetaceae bacterium]
MHREQKIGLGLGVLLVGVVAAFFFRNEETADEVPRLGDTTVVDARVAERENMPYLTGVEPAPSDFSERRANRPVASPEIAGDARTSDPFDLAPPPEPISTSPVSAPASVAAGDARRGAASASGPNPSVPPHNNAWNVRSPRPEPSGSPAARSVGSDAARDRGEKTHVVRPGDTLTGIAARYLGHSGRYLELYRHNQDVLADPHALRVGMTLRIPPANGRLPEPPRPSPSSPAPAAPAVPSGTGPTAESNPGARPVSTSRPGSPASDAANAGDGILRPPTDPPAATPGTAPTPPSRPRFVPVPHSPLNPGPRRLSQVPPNDLPP